MNIKKDIENYIQYLENAHGLYISLHPKVYERLISVTDLLRFNIHKNPYCLYIKSDENMAKRCNSCQQGVYEKCRSGEFSGICYAGVYEFVYPISSEKGVIGFISVSGYRVNKNYDKPLSKISRESLLSYDMLRDMYYNSLKPDIPKKEEIDILIHPLCRMLELAYRLLPEPDSDTGKADNLYTKILHYLNLNRGRTITLDSICRELYCSKSYVSHIFKNRSGSSISEYLNKIRINDAKMLLINSDLNITQIALSVGFSDSCYFAAVFKKYEKISPAAYRLKNIKK